ncbi:MAG TPA: hypothetical protein VKG43_01160 [Acidimicrobiales bacterium]|nr:hypothetical protein [Acidimicrobiales bacterium]
MDTADLLAAACPPINTMGSAFYFAPATLQRGDALGLDGFRFYFLGRGGVLGDVEPRVIVSAFGYFKPSLVEHIWDTARQIAPPREAGRAYRDACAEFGREALSDLPGLEPLGRSLDAVNAAADPIGLALYAGVSAEPLADDPPARVMQLVTTLRELRGSAHLVAIRACGLEAPVAHYLKRPNDFTLFGWGEDEIPEVTEADRQALADAERLTDDLLRPAFGVLDPDGANALVDGLAAMHDAL